MSIAAVKRAFNEALGSAGQCQSATLRYERIEGGAQVQRLSFEVKPQGGAVTTVTDTAPGGVDPVSKAIEMAEAYVASLGD